MADSQENKSCCVALRAEVSALKAAIFNLDDGPENWDRFDNMMDQVESLKAFALQGVKVFLPLAQCCGQPPRQLDQDGQTLILCTACARTVGGPIGTVARAWGVLVQ